MTMRPLSANTLGSRAYPPRAVAGTAEWTRPSDWLPMPATAANQIDVLAAVWDHESNYCALHIHVETGTWDIDWGDGTIETGLVSGTKRDHLYDYADPQLDGTLTTRGYKQAMIKITPSAGSGAITAMDFSEKNTTVALPNNTVNPWLEVQCNTPGLTTLANAFYYNTVNALCRMLERVNFVALGNVASLFQTFQKCSRLQSVGYPAGSLVNVTTLSNTYNGCNMLPSSTWPAGSLAFVTTINSTYSGCYALKSVAWPAGSLGLVTEMDLTHYANYSLRACEYPAGSLSLVTTASRALQACQSLPYVAWPTGSMANVTDATQLYITCYALQTIINPPGAFAAVTTTTSMHRDNLSLANITNCLLPVSFSVESCKLSGAALDEIYTSLPTVVGQTITVTGNFGTATHTPSIATAKGWTVTV